MTGTEMERILQGCQALYGEAGIPVKVVEADEQFPYASLLVAFDGIGEQERNIQLDICFLPSLQSSDEDPVQLLQTFVSICEAPGVTLSPDMHRFIQLLNTNLPLGAFGWMEEAGVLFYKANTIIDTAVDQAQNVKMMDRQNGLILHIHQLFMDVILDVWEGNASYEEARERTPFT
ncbi:hypothetical protein [Marinicrinis sediminis]|uniref:YbjN domain-containing protein n=1 Tax=Marinicrinis sediminis TaxID=1652465 RepID=A0ABW5RB14_9BACL